ncbi:MAG: PIN domain-containing protein [Planctomycetes bacterium]|nr:PIN domain-containing protein [Planctomycetota bacterium]
MTYVVDTHALVWFLEGNPRLSQAAEQAMRDTSARLVIPTIALAEMTFLYAKLRIATSLSTVWNTIAGVSNWVLHPLDEPVVRRLPTSLNIHDAIIVATALVHRDVLGESTALISKDTDITASGLIQVIW